jgi:hypothetical protein
MNKFEWRSAEVWSLRHASGRVLLVVLALLLVALSAPWIIRPLVAALTMRETPASVDEPWPDAPPTYAPPTVAPPPAPRNTPLPTPLPPPVWRELSNLTIIEFTTSTVAEVSRRREVLWVGEMVTDRLLLRAVGKVQLGVNLRRVRDVEIDGRKIRFVAPAPVVTGVELLPDQSQVYDHSQVLFLSQSEGLENEALENARRQFYQEVGGNPSMVELAEQFARLQLSEFLRKAGFESVEIEFEPSAFLED